MRLLKRLGLVALILLVVLVSVLAINTLRFEGEPLADGPLPAPPIDADAVERLALAIRIPTVSTETGPASDEALAAFSAHLERSFPRVHAKLKRERIGSGSLLYTWPGSDSSAPGLLLAAHQDVVPVDVGSEGSWIQPPFSGAVTGSFVWGRGTLDDKGSLMAILEAVERQLAQGFVPEQTIYLAFGHDEELGGYDGARKIAALLRQRSVRIGLALDEAAVVLDGVIAGVTCPVAMIGIAEKGYVSVELRVTAPGGHSSMPSNDNAAVRIARAVTRIADAPMPARIGGIPSDTLDAIAPYSSTPMRIVLANRWLTAPLVRRQLLASPESAASIRTTATTTILQSGTKDNVLPQHARAVVNHRILPGDTIDSVLANDRRAAGDPRIQLRALPGARNPSKPAATTGAEYQRVALAIRATFPHAAVAPGLVVGASDGRHYEGLARAVFRFAPYTLGKDDLARLHGNNERIAIADYMRAIAFYERLISG